MSFRTLTVHTDIHCRPGGLTQLRGRLIEHVAITFLRQLRSKYPDHFAGLKALEILKVLFRKKKAAADKAETIRTIIELLYQHFPGFTFFHNHVGSTDRYHYNYSMIHYRTKKGKARLVAFGPAVPVVKQWLMLAHPESWMSLNKVRFREEVHAFQITEQPVYYRLMDWSPLNSENYQQWRRNPLMRDRLHLLEQALTGQIRLALETFSALDPKQVTADLVLIKSIRAEQAYQEKKIIANVLFRGNVSIPAPIALGRSVSIGYGTQGLTRWQEEAVPVTQ